MFFLAMRCAEHLGFKHADHFLDGLTAEQLYDWWEYERRTGPLGHARDDVFHGQQMAIYVNSKSGQQATKYKPIDFMIYTERPEQTNHLRNDLHA